MNGEYRGDSDIGKLVRDFNCSRADDMNFQLMADRIRYLKENTRGVIEMCQVMKNMRTESLKEIALRMLAAGNLKTGSWLYFIATESPKVCFLLFFVLIYYFYKYNPKIYHEILPDTNFCVLFDIINLQLYYSVL